MRRFDLSPLMKSSIGFDHLNRMLDTAFAEDGGSSYPPYNIEKISEDDYQISMAVAGFSPEELVVTVEENRLIIRSESLPENSERSYLHRGIAKRAFDRQFNLAESIKVGDAAYENGLLVVNLKRIIPEHKKPRQIEIRNGKSDAVHTALEVDAA
ncbi:Hsp20 family protein [Temperatibacter marinus]|uniref:Hsp20 family protein n=1 Tax=Temperatibacter marinus TaxID=1456591 RepID=A0AA52H9H1_9PROT|nr:Hsp20 family protein [Temperatibacter marinus]WND02904.1 Hsp20 family protein [Temperatibacter marinus]